MSKDDGSEVIVLEDVSLSYKRTTHKFVGVEERRSVLTNISLVIREGEVVGIVGRNGSGKSTLTRVIGGLLPPDKGSVRVAGSVTVLGPGSGIVPSLSARENIYLNGAFLGLARRDVASMVEEIAAFAEIGESLDEPVKTYSAGMRARLSFSIATHLTPEILIIDELLATGDSAFRRKSERRIAEIVRGAKAVIVVAHQVDFLLHVCNRVLWLSKGIIRQDGMPKRVIGNYLAAEG